MKNFLIICLLFIHSVLFSCPQYDKETIIAISNQLIRDGVENRSVFDLQRAKELRECVGETKGKSWEALLKLIELEGIDKK